VFALILWCTKSFAPILRWEIWDIDGELDIIGCVHKMLFLWWLNSIGIHVLVLSISYYRIFVPEDPTLPRILGVYSILKAVALIHCTLYIHYKP
jgi:hypothetical protein